MTVHLIGAGPGDPGLLTLRGAELLARADVVIFDRLSAAGLLDLAPPDAERISVAERAGSAVMTQEQINELLIERGRTTATVVRLGEGDPFVFARGGEEAAALAAAGIDFEVVPGISSAIAVPAYAGIPVTMRHSSTSFTVITGHEDPAKGEGSEWDVDWEAAARLGGTIVILIGVGRIRSITERLLAGGLHPDTPAAAVRWGTRPDQVTVRATLSTLADRELASPSVIVIGAVAAQDLGWFESRPLFGRRVVITRPKHQVSVLAERIRAEGADPLIVPTIEIDEPTDDGASVRAAIAELQSQDHRYDWVVFTSANGVERFCDQLRDARDLGGVRVAAIGPGTADALLDRNVVADLVPERFIAESLLEAFPMPHRGDGGHSGRVLLARAEVARDVLPDGLRSMGWSVDIADTYRTIAVTPTDERRNAVRDADVVTFTSSSTVENWVAAFGVNDLPPIVACIGPITADTARRLGVRVDVVASVHTIDGLIDAVIERITDPEGRTRVRSPRARGMGRSRGSRDGRGRFGRRTGRA